MLTITPASALPTNYIEAFVADGRDAASVATDLIAMVDNEASSDWDTLAGAAVTNSEDLAYAIDDDLPIVVALGDTTYVVISV